MQMSAGDFRGLVKWFQVNAGECKWLKVSAGEFNFYTLCPFLLQSCRTLAFAVRAN